MEHHYSLTGRMQTILIGGLLLLVVLIFCAGLLAGRELGISEEKERIGAAQRGGAGLAGSNPTSGPIRPTEKGSALPSIPETPKLPQVPKAPAIPGLPPLKK